MKRACALLLLAGAAAAGFANETNGPEMEVLAREKIFAEFHSLHLADSPLRQLLRVRLERRVAEAPRGADRLHHGRPGHCARRAGKAEQALGGLIHPQMTGVEMLEEVRQRGHAVEDEERGGYRGARRGGSGAAYEKEVMQACVPSVIETAGAVSARRG